MSHHRRIAVRLRKVASNLSLRQQVGIATGLLSLVLVAAVAIGAANVGRDQARRYVGNEMADLARTLADRLDRNMASRVQDAILLSSLEPLREIWAGDPATIRSALESFQQKTRFIAWVGFAAPDGTVKAATSGLLEGQSVRERPWFRHGQAGVVAEDVHEAVLLAALLGPTTSGEASRFVDVAAPVMNAEGGLAGVLGFHLSWDWAAEVVEATRSAIDPAAATDLWILSRDGAVLYGPQFGTTPFPPLRRAEMTRSMSGAFVDDASAEPALTGFAMTQGSRNFPGLGWIVVARRPTEIAYASAHKIVSTILLLGLLTGGAGIVVATIIAGGISRPIRRLTVEADRIGRDPTMSMLPHVQGSLEVAQLSAALRSLLRRIDVTEREMAEVEERSAEETRKLNLDIDALKELADTDPLTSLPNRRGMVRFNDDVASGFEREGRVYSVLVADIDHFKRINDTYGHAIGDIVIRQVAAVVAESVRPSDRVARYGGEEFVAVLRDITLARAAEVAERVRASVEEAGLVHDGKPLPVTVSIGVAVVTPVDRDVQDVIERADLALYAAKAGGRNRVSVSAAPQVASEQAAA